jgi:hypothetical protein
MDTVKEKKKTMKVWVVQRTDDFTFYRGKSSRHYDKRWSKVPKIYTKIGDLRKLLVIFRRYYLSTPIQILEYELEETNCLSFVEFKFTDPDPIAQVFYGVQDIKSGKFLHGSVRQGKAWRSYPKLFASRAGVLNACRDKKRPLQIIEWELISQQTFSEEEMRSYEPETMG